MQIKKRFRIHFDVPRQWLNLASNWRTWLPSRGNVLFTLLVVGCLLWVSSTGAVPLGTPIATSTSTNRIAYQGRLANANGASLTGTYPMIFRLYSAASGGTPLWEEQWTATNSIAVTDGLFNVLLGSLNAMPQNVVTGNSSLWLGISVGSDNEMTPRVQVGSVPFAIQALTVPDGSITQAKLAPDVSFVPPDGSITTAKLADGAVTQAKAPMLIASLHASTRIEFGTGTWTGSWGQNPAAQLWYRDTAITFTTPFTSPPIVVINVSDAHPDSWAKVKDITSNTFVATNLALVDLGGVSPGTKTFTWIAIGQ